MNKRTIQMIILLLSMIISALSYASQKDTPVPSTENALTPERQRAVVTRVVDGDTLIARIDNTDARVRLIGVDAPESVDPRKIVECFGKESSGKLKTVLEGKTVLLESDPTQGDTDKYQRLLRYVYLEGETTPVNAYIISEGYAHEYTYTIPYRYQDIFKDAERHAQTAARGLWDPNTCPQEK